jgi:molybdate transport system regulatory protein
MNNFAETPLVESTTGGRHRGGTRMSQPGRRPVARYRATQAEQQQTGDRLIERMADEPTAESASQQRLLRRLSVRIVDGPVNAEVRLALGGRRSASAVATQASVAALRLAAGRRACAVRKVSNVILAVVDGPPCAALRS